MKGKKHTPEQIIAKLREADAELNGGGSSPGGLSGTKPVRLTMSRHWCGGSWNWWPGTRATAIGGSGQCSNSKDVI